MRAARTRRDGPPCDGMEGATEDNDAKVREGGEHANAVGRMLPTASMARIFVEGPAAGAQKGEEDARANRMRREEGATEERHEEESEAAGYVGDV